MIKRNTTHPKSAEKRLTHREGFCLLGMTGFVCGFVEPRPELSASRLYCVNPPAHHHFDRHSFHPGDKDKVCRWEARGCAFLRGREEEDDMKSKSDGYRFVVTDTTTRLPTS